jgi:hypothetical protein
MRRLPRLFSHLLGVAGCTHQLWNAEFRNCMAAFADTAQSVVTTPRAQGD